MKAICFYLVLLVVVTIWGLHWASNMTDRVNKRVDYLESISKGLEG